MAIIAATDLGNGLQVLRVDHDPTSVATLAAQGSMIIDANGDHFLKKDSGSTTNVAKLQDADDVAAGVAEDVFRWTLISNVNAGTRFDALRAARRAGTIVGVIVSAGARGQNGTSLFDINRHVPTKPITTQRNATAGVTIYTTQANRPDLDGSSPNSTDDAIKQAVLPDVTSFAAGDFFSLDVDVAVNQLADIVVQMFVQYS